MYSAAARAAGRARGRWPAAARFAQQRHHSPTAYATHAAVSSSPISGAAVVAFALPAVRSGHWAGLHLALAGAALVAGWVKRV